MEQKKLETTEKLMQVTIVVPEGELCALTNYVQSMNGKVKKQKKVTGKVCKAKLKMINKLSKVSTDPSHLEVRNQDKERDNENYELDTIVSKDRCRYCLEYLEHKLELGCVLDDVREVMPACVVYYARNKWPNPEGIPYKGHIPSL